MTGNTIGTVRWVLRLEGLMVLLLAIASYYSFAFSWSTFAWYFLLPDASLLAYLIDARIGAIIYNSAHSYIGAIVCALLYVTTQNSLWLNISLIWFAHIGFDRALGYGLKYQLGFRYTHLGLIGRQPANTDK